MTTKSCTKCRVAKALTEFYKDARASDGRCSSCRACHNAVVTAYAKAHRDVGRAATRRWREANPGQGKAANSAWRKANRDKMSAHQRRYARNNPAQIRSRNAAWARKNRGKMNAKDAAHEARKLMATPPWSDRRAMRGFYEHAAALRAQTGQSYDVDHIVPLNSELVCGLHVPANLQVIPKRENLKKSNQSWPDMP